MRFLAALVLAFPDSEEAIRTADQAIGEQVDALDARLLTLERMAAALSPLMPSAPIIQVLAPTPAGYQWTYVPADAPVQPGELCRATEATTNPRAPAPGEVLALLPIAT